jgi:hypothetical protein
MDNDSIALGGPVGQNEPQPIDGPTALRLLREVVAERPNYRYRAPDDRESCVYAYDGQPSCLVGHVLHRVGFSLALLEYLGEDSIDGCAVVADETARKILGSAQGEQDGGLPWATALQSAEYRAADLGVSA